MGLISTNGRCYDGVVDRAHQLPLSACDKVHVSKIAGLRDGMTSSNPRTARIERELVSGYRSADGLPTKTGIAPIDTAITKTLAFEQSHLGNPLVQVALLGFAGFGIYKLLVK